MTDFRRRLSRGLLVDAAVTMTSVLLTFGTAYLLHRVVGLGIDVVVQAVVLALTMARAANRGRSVGGHAASGHPALGYLLLPAVTLLAAADGILMSHHPSAGQVLFVVIITLSIWVRRFGPLASQLGTLATLPLIAILIIRVPVVPSGGSETRHALWMAAIAIIVGVWVGLTRLLARRLGFLPAAPPTVRGGAGENRAGGNGAPATRGPGRRRLPASTRMAMQTGLALGGAFAAGRAIFPDHVMWLVLTAYIVTGGARGRGDALHKAGLRVLGAGLGTLAATVGGSAFGPGNTISVVLIFVILGVATLLRPVSYAFWAAGVTAVLSLLYGYFGQVGTRFLDDRLEAIVVGAAIAVCASWVVLPVRTVDVARKWIAESLAILSELLAAWRSEPAEISAHAARLRASLARLDQVARPLAIERALRGTGLARRFAPHRRHIADGVEAVRALLPAVATLAAHPEAGTSSREIMTFNGAVRANIGAVRRAIGRRPGEAYRPLPPRGGEAPAPGEAMTVVAALADIDAVIAALADVFGDPPRPAQTQPSHAELVGTTPTTVRPVVR
jgi:hypothetical protein